MICSLCAFLKHCLLAFPPSLPASQLPTFLPSFPSLISFLCILYSRFKEMQGLKSSKSQVHWVPFSHVWKGKGISEEGTSHGSCSRSLLARNGTLEELRRCLQWSLPVGRTPLPECPALQQQGWSRGGESPSLHSGPHLEEPGELSRVHGPARGTNLGGSAGVPEQGRC